MPLNQKVPTWFAVPAVLAVLSVISYQVLLAPENLEGTKKVLTMAKTIPIPVDGPESIEFDPQGEGPYAAVVDGRILKWRGDDLGWVEFAYTSPHRFLFFILLQRCLLEQTDITCIMLPLLLKEWCFRIFIYIKKQYLFNYIDTIYFVD